MRLHPAGLTCPNLAADQARGSDLYMPHTLSAFLVLLIETQWECEEGTLSLHALLPRTGTTKKSVYVLKMLNEHWLCKTWRYRVRSGEWGQASFFFFSSLVTWVHRRLDPVLDVIISLEESMGYLPVLVGPLSLLEGKGPWETFPSLSIPEVRSLEWSSLALRVSDLFDKL